jgi:hypothetical protein
VFDALRDLNVDVEDLVLAAAPESLGDLPAGP